MATQHDKDWEDYQYGLQGTNTGSAYNQMGLSDRQGTQVASHRGSRKAAKNVRSKPGKASGKEDFSPLFATIAFIGTAIHLYEPNEDSVVAVLIVAGIAGLLAGKLYKVIIFIATLIAAVYLLGYVNSGS